MCIRDSYEASAEFTQVWRRLLLGETVNFNGKHIHVRGAKLLFPPIQQPYPPLYFGGSSDVAQELAAEQVEDVYKRQRLTTGLTVVPGNAQ